MSVIEGIYHSPDIAIDERRLIACDAEGRLIETLAPGSSTSGMRTDVFAIGRLECGESVTTDPIDLGESHGYTQPDDDTHTPWRQKDHLRKR
jgi:hypothetical protein